MTRTITVGERIINLEHGAEFTLIPDFTVGDGREVTISSPGKYCDGYTATVRGNKYAHKIVTFDGTATFGSPASVFEANSLPSEVTPEELAIVAAVVAELNAEYANARIERKASQATAAKSQIAAEENRMAQFGDPQIFD